MKTSSELGKNLTGIALSPFDGKELVDYVQRSPTSQGDASALLEARRAWSEEAEPVGSVPPPMTLKGAGKQVVQALKGTNPAVFMDCLGERLGFERTGVRLYDALIAKRDAAGELRGGPSRADLDRLRADELRHFEVLTETVTRLGGDPTVVTPGADVAGVEAMGLLQVLTDPRTTFEQALHAILVAELADNDGWRTLIELVQDTGQEGMLEPFRKAQEDEDRHLREVRAWAAALKRQALGLGASASA